MKKYCLILLMLMPNQALAEKFPIKNVRFVVPAATGGGGDITARIIAQGLTEIWKQTIVVDNRPGAGGNIANQLVAKTEDSHTFLFATSTVATAPSVYKEAEHTVQQLQMISLVAQQPLIPVDKITLGKLRLTL